jgi:hypothetical protein
MNNIKFFLLAVLSLFVLVFFVLFYKKNMIEKSNEVSNVVPPRDYVLESQNTPKVIEGKLALVKKDFEGAYSSFKEAANNTTDVNVKSAIEVSAAGSLMNVDTGKGAEYYMEIVNNQSYPAVSRGFALLQIAQFYRGNRDASILKPYLKDKVDLEKSTIEDIEYRLYTDIYNIYPYGIAAARKGIYELKQSPSTSTAQTVLEKYSSSIDSNIESMKPFVGMKTLVPNTYMAKNSMYRELYKYGVVTSGQIIDLYEKADAEAKAQGNKITEQFNLLSYANYLASLGQTEKTKIILGSIKTSGVEAMINRNLSKESSKLDYPALVALSKKDTLVKEFFSQFSW